MLEKQENLTELAGKTVIDWDPDQGLQAPTHTIYRIRVGYNPERATEVKENAATHTIYRIRVGYNGPETWTASFATFLQDPAVSQLTGLVVGMWSTEVMQTEQAIEVVEAVAAA